MGNTPLLERAEEGNGRDMKDSELARRTHCMEKAGVVMVETWK